MGDLVQIYRVSARAVVLEAGNGSALASKASPHLLLTASCHCKQTKKIKSSSSTILLLHLFSWADKGPLTRHSAIESAFRPANTLASA